LPAGRELRRPLTANGTGGRERRPDKAATRDPAGFVASAMLPAIPLGLAIAAIGQWLLAMPVLVWAGLILAAGNLAGFAGFVVWYRRRERRAHRQWQERIWQEGSDDE
jgi:hypothetical protein